MLFIFQAYFHFRAQIVGLLVVKTYKNQKLIACMIVGFCSPITCSAAKAIGEIDILILKILAPKPCKRVGISRSCLGGYAFLENQLLIIVIVFVSVGCSQDAP